LKKKIKKINKQRIKIENKMKIDKIRIEKIKHETNINKKKIKNKKTIKREWKQMKQGKGNIVK